MNHGLVVSLLLALSISAVAVCGCISPTDDENTVSGTGTVAFIDLEGGFYGIVADDGSHYYPLNLDAEFQVDGLPISFSGILRRDIATTAQWGAPIELTHIEHAQVTMEESRQIAEDYVTSMPEYTDNDGRNLRLVETLTLRCPYCWQFVYQFDMRSMKDPDVVDQMSVAVTVQEGEVVSVFSSAGLPIGILTVAELLEHPAYDTEVRITGTVSLLGELFCPCFRLSSGGQNLEVWYALMVEDNGTAWPEVSMEGIENGDSLIITGVLKPSGIHNAEDVFWARAIEKNK
jgi:hypothetical protein